MTAFLSVILFKEDKCLISKVHFKYMRSVLVEDRKCGTEFRRCTDIAENAFKN